MPGNQSCNILLALTGDAARSLADAIVRSGFRRGAAEMEVGKELSAASVCELSCLSALPPAASGCSS